MKPFLFAVLVMLFLQTTAACAVQPAEMLADPVLEARARAISQELRCPVCQNQSIDDSDADLAHDLRVLVRQRIEKGDTDAQAIQYVVSRYGDYVLLDPPLKEATIVLWAGPVMLLLCSFLLARGFFRVKEEQAMPLSEKEKKRLALLLDDEETGDEE